MSEFAPCDRCGSHEIVYGGGAMYYCVGCDSDDPYMIGADDKSRIVYAVITVQDASGCENLQHIFSSREKAERYITEILDEVYGKATQKAGTKRWYFNEEYHKWGYHAITARKVDDIDWDEEEGE